ncbi:sulfate ABC transporter substrate-binding protein [Verrucomicrobium sp. BvORR106]|uniref:sulfate ABC transporter substrate-binding protein n=1 Tax=Verrucomicrobium sp. BvORR106 TaxID=1403819 RepID=UPI00068B9C92|nr:sulfate ABC transporter substrate-binding protein [Verrucomicrobium sp. BvORR106]
MSNTSPASRSLFRRDFVRRTLLASTLLLSASLAHAEEPKLLNSSYDVTREFYKQVNDLFVPFWKAKGGATVQVDQSHGGSSKQARAVLDGLEADVVTFNQSTDVDLLVPAGLVAADWRTKFPHNASPYTSTILFLVRKGNPKGIKDWPDLVKSGAQVIIPNPKTSGNGRYSYVGAWAWSIKNEGGDEAKAKDFVKKLFANVPVLDTGGRGATNSFAQNGIGDVLLTFENEVHLTIRELGADKFDVVVPPQSILADAPIAIVEPVAKKHGTTDLAKAYLDYLFTDEVQEVAAKNYFRPANPEILKKHAASFPEIKLVTIDEILGGWKKALEVHFKDGGVFDQIYAR